MLDCQIYQGDLERILSVEYPWERIRGRRILITGATGMVGSMLVDVLASVMEDHGFELTAMSRNESELERLFSMYRIHDGFSMVAHDVNEPIDLQCDTVFHCASNTHPRLYSSDPIGTIATNVIGLRNLLEMATSSGDGRFVFLSSVEVYGQNRGDVDSFDEFYCGYIDCNTVRAGYNESKRVGEALCQAYGLQKGLDFVIPRLSRLYGPSMRLDDSKAMSQFLLNSARGENIVLKSKGDQFFSYCYASDAVSAILHLFFHGESGNAYNVSGLDSDFTLADIAYELASMAGAEVVFDLPDEKERRGYSTATKAILDISKVKATGWMPEVSMKDGLRRTVSSLALRL